MKREYLAFDIGASSGRGIVGSLENGKIELTEVHRFPNVQVLLWGHYYWDILKLFEELKEALSNSIKKGYKNITSLGVDTWGVDFGLIGRDNVLLGNPYSYRDSRTNDIMEEAFKMMPAKDMYKYTGIQFMQFNSVFQLYSMVKTSHPLLPVSEKLLFTPDLLNYMFTGEMVSEYSIASTSQLLNANTRQWEPEIFAKLSLPIDIMPEIVKTGTRIGPILSDIASETGASNIDVVAPASHDTASAVAAVPAKGENWAYLSSGTWSLMGIETASPLINDLTLSSNFTNEGGINDTIRFLKNIMGMWLLNGCRKEWIDNGISADFGVLLESAKSATPFKAIIHPDDPIFLNPPNMIKAICEYCSNKNQPAPETPGEFTRTILESLALKYRYVIEIINQISDSKITTLHIVGGGSQNELLNQYAANACGIPVVAGPIEATAIGNIMVQAITAGEIGSIEEGREIVKNSFEMKTFEPQETVMWDEAYQKYNHLFK